MAKRTRPAKSVETLTHGDATRKNIPTAEYQTVMREEDQNPIRVAYERRNRDLDPQLVWRGKDEQDGLDLIVQAPPLFIQEKVHPKVLIDDLTRRHRVGRADRSVRRFQRLARSERGDRVLSARRQLVEPHDPRRRDTSRPFAKPTSGRIAVKVINHLGDEVMKVFRV